jgi:hypothetical protein
LGAVNPSFKGKMPTGEGECRIVGGTKVTDAGVAKLTALKNLKRLDLSGSPVTPAGLKRIEGLQRLERLSLWNCTALDDTIAPTLAGLPNLSSLDLSYTGVSDAAMKQFSGMARLKDLYLTDTKVTSDAAEAWRKAKPGARVFWAVRPPARPVATPTGASKKTDDME